MSMNHALSLQTRLHAAVDGDPQGFYPTGQEVVDLSRLVDALDEYLREYGLFAFRGEQVGGRLREAFRAVTRVPS